MELWWFVLIGVVVWVVLILVGIWHGSRDRDTSAGSSETKKEVQYEKQNNENTVQSVDNQPNKGESKRVSHRELSVDEEGLGDESWQRLQDQGSIEDRYGPGRF